MILGIGTDLVEVARCRRVLERHPRRFVARILTPSEQALFRQSARPERYLAKRFAAKEAAAKALGTGFAAGVGWQDLWVESDPAGRPCLRLHPALAARFAAGQPLRAHLSITDERDYVLAFVVIERDGPPPSQA